MSSPMSPVIANIFMEHFEKEKPQKNTQKTKSLIPLCRRHMIWRHSRAELHKFLIFLNNQHPNIHFIIDIGENGKLSFLDVLVPKKADGTLGHQVYRKSTHI